jgi:hypothetical protein
MMIWVPGYYTGIAISTKEISFVSLKKKGRGRARVKECGAIPIPQGTFSDGIITDRALIRELLLPVAKKSGLRRALTTSALSPRQCVIRSAKMPAMPEKELLQALRWEAERYSFLAGNPFSLDYVKIGEVEEEGLSKQELLVLAVKDNVLHELCRLLKEAGLLLKAIDIEPMAYLYLRTFASLNKIWPEPEEAWAGIELSPDKTVVSFYSEHYLQFVHTIPLSYSYDPDIAGDIIREVQRSFDYYHLNLKKMPVRNVYLWGNPEESLLENAGNALEESMAYSFIRLPGEPLAQALDLAAGLPPGGELALGLALREVLP